jgi:putative FmdB family regulatory protein
MATWVYRCGGCDITFAVEVEDGAQASETAVCPQCGSPDARKEFELPTATGGCACGGKCC